MREILFRGKRVQGGEWVYGDFYRSDINKRERKSGKATLIFTPDIDTFIYIREQRNSVMVIPETVGQYTGLKDKNGTKIFEGDIVRLIDKFVDFRTYAVIEFGNPNGLYNWGWQLRPLENKPFAVEILHWVDMEESGAYIEVIGNIHDNPNLLEGVRE